VTRPFVLVLALLALPSCGYRLASPSADSLGPLAVEPSPVVVASAFAEAELCAGARRALAAEGRLASCSPRTDARCPALVVELVRVEEGGASPGVLSSGASPLDRTVTLTLRGRAFVRRTKGASPERLGPDITVRELVARGDDPVTFHVAQREALGRAARRLGERLAQGVLR